MDDAKSQKQAQTKVTKKKAKRKSSKTSSGSTSVGARMNSKHDWDALYKEYLKQNRSVKEFLESKDINPKTPGVREQTHWWRASVEETRKYLAKLGKELITSPKPAVDNIYEIIKGWRENISMRHYKLAHIAGLHCELLLEEGLVLDEETGQPKGTTLKGSDLRAIMSSLSDIQRMQRLALGLSADNPGVDMPAPGPETDGDGNEIEHEGPVFVVEVNERGKFARPRPRVVSGNMGGPEPKKKAGGE